METSNKDKSVLTLLNILFRPKEAAKHIEEKANFRLPLIIGVIACTILFAIAGYFDAQLDPSVIEGSDMSLQDSLIVGAVISGFGGLFIGFLTPLVEASFLWMLLFLFGNRTSYQKLFSLSCYLTAILVPLFALISIAITQDISVIFDEPTIGTSLAYWIPNTSDLTYALLSQVEVTMIWELVILFFVIRALAKLSTLKTSLFITIFAVIQVALAILIYTGPTV